MNNIYKSFKDNFRSSSSKTYYQVDKYKIFIKFIISGGIAGFVDLSLLYILTDILNVWYLLSAGLAFIIAFFISFTLQKFWTFRDNNRERIYQQMSLYFIVGVMNLFLNIGGMYLLVDRFKIWYLLSQVITGGFLGISSFLIYKFIIFKKKRIESRKHGDGGLKILIATGIFPPDIGGPATYVETLCQELPKLGCEVRVITYNNKIPNPKSQILNKFKIQNSNVQIFNVSRKQNILFRYWKYFWQVWKLAGWADIIYVQGPVSEGLPSWLACKLRSKKYVLKIVGDYAWEQGKQRFGVKELLDDFQAKKYGWRVELMRKIQKLVAHDSCKIIVPSRYLKKIINSWGIKEDKIKIIYNSVEEINLDTDKEKVKRDLNLNGNIILSVGRLVPWKGFSLLVDLMPELAKDDPDFKLIIIGAGPEEEKIKEKIKNLGVEEKVILTGSLSQPDLWKYMIASDMFLLNTGYEGLSHVVIEAMQLGLPVIITDIGGNPEVVENNKTGLLIDYNNKDQIKEAIIKLSRNKNLVFDLTANAKKQIVEKFSKERMIIDICRQLKGVNYNKVS